MKENSLIEIFCLVDDFCKEFEPQWHSVLLQQASPKKDKRKKRSPRLSLSEVMTIAICFHASRYRTFKDYYTRLVEWRWREYFPRIVSYSRFVFLMQRAVFPLFVFLQGCLGTCTGVSFVDSTVLGVCSLRRISSHKVFRNQAKRGKTSTGWFFGFKLHLIINHIGEIIAYSLTPGNSDDRKPFPQLTKNIFGKIFGDRGYISSKLFRELWDKGIELITRIKKGMKNKLLPIMDKLLLRRRGLIESVHNKLKACCQIEHHRHRSIWNFLVNLLAGLTAYSLEPQKPKLHLQKQEYMLLEQLSAA